MQRARNCDAHLQLGTCLTKGRLHLECGVHSMEEMMLKSMQGIFETKGKSKCICMFVIRQIHVHCE